MEKCVIYFHRYIEIIKKLVKSNKKLTKIVFLTLFREFRYKHFLESLERLSDLFQPVSF